MPTLEVDSRTHSRLPDIFRTINGDNLDIGPLDRLREENESGVSWGRAEKGATGRGHFPRIILRDALGHELDTFTTLQEAIYRAKWNVKQSGQSKEPLEWRLPKAPPPARPDLTRTFPPLKHPPVHPPDGKFKGRFDSSKFLEFDIEDVGFVRESLQYLPYAPSLSFLRQEILVGPKTYFQIVGTLLLHKRILSQTEKRNAVYNFPGFCSGCMRMGLCYGCERSTEIHFHEDKPVKTGGGFTYFKKDRPENEIRSKNPINWKIQHPDQALKKLMEEYAGVDLEGPIPVEIKKHLDKHGGHREKIVSHIPDFAREMQEIKDKESLEKGDDGDLPSVHVKYGEDGETDGDLSREGEGHSDNGGHDLDVGDVKVHIQGQGDNDEGDGPNGNQGRQRYRGGRKKEKPTHLAVPGSGAASLNKTQSDMQDDPSKSGYVTSDDESYRDGSYDRQFHRLSKYRPVQSGSDEENDENEHSDNGTGSPRRGRRKERLYAAPPPFKLKKSPKRSIQSKSPFSTDRSYDLPKGSAFEVKKSGKPLTQFKEFRNVDASWKEPKKFELKKGDQKTTKFWSGPPKKKEKKKGERSRALRRVPSPRSVSPDSGLDSEFLTAHFSVSILNKQNDVKPQTRKFSNQGGLTSRPSLRNTSFISPLPGSAKLRESKFSNRETPDETIHDDQDDMKDQRETDTKHARQSSNQQKYTVYQPRSSAISPILYQGDKPDVHIDPKRVIGRERRSMSISVVTLTPQLYDHKDTTNKSELEPIREETLTVTPDMSSLSERAGTPLQLRVHSPVTDKPPRSVSPPRKKEIVKKVKKPRSPIRSPAPPPKPPTPVKEKTPSPVEEPRPASREISFDFVKEKSIPELPPIEIPDLPEIQERQSEYKEKKKERKLIEVTPELPEGKKKLPPPPKLAPRIKTRTSRKSKVAEAPVTTQELQQLSDPLDFLAKYCIINPDRLPYYERVFNGAVNIQTPRYTRDNMTAPGGMVHLPPAQLSEHELNMLRDMTVITHAQSPRREGISVPEQYLEKLNYSIDFIKSKQEVILDHMHELQGEKIHLMAQLAKQLDRDIVRVDYKTKGKKKKKDDDEETSPKKKKKKKTDEHDYDTMGAMSVPKNFMPQRASDITDEVIVSRMDDKMMKKVKKDPAVKNFNMLINRDIEKLKNFDQRITQIEDEKDLVGLYCMDNYFNEQAGSAPPYAFRRQQSRLYQKLHPDPDIEMNMEEVETSLQQINNKLLSEKEFQYIYFILDLPKREKINFRLFSIIAALSEKVTQMDPVIRKLINKVDYNALDIKMDKSKELFELIQDESLMPVGNAPADTLAVELTAGGLTPEHTSYVLSKFNREGRGFVDFLDFVTYIPLFIEIHKRIIQDPFNDAQDV